MKIKWNNHNKKNSTQKRAKNKKEELRKKWETTKIHQGATDLNLTYTGFKFKNSTNVNSLKTK